MTVFRVLLVSCLTLTQYAAAQHERTSSFYPEVFLVTIDTLRADHIHCYGYDRVQTPALDELAKTGIRFAQAFTPSPITNTSHASIFTGLLPGMHGMTDFAVALSASHPTWAELLKQHAYHTAGFIGAVILDSKTLAPGLDRGFDFYDNFSEHPQTTSRWGRVERRGLEVVQHAETWLSAHPAGAHFVWVHLYDPHDPYDPPAPYSQIYKDHLYDGEIAYADSALGAFLTFLKKHGLYQNAIIVIVGDHGEGLGEHGENTHGIFLYDSTTHVPLIFKLPAATNAGKVVHAQVRTTDILATVLDLAHIPSPPNLDGESLKPYFTDTNPPDRTAFGETDYPVRFGWAPLKSVRADGMKFIEAPRPEFYDLRSDAAELNNKYEPWNEQVRQFRDMLAQVRAKEPTREISKVVVGQETINELKALGYLGPVDTESTTNVPEPWLLPDPKDRIEELNLLHTAMIAGEENRAADAHTALEKVLQLDQKSPSALRELGEVEVKAGDYEKAAQHLKAAMEVCPDDASVALYAGQALEKVHDLAAARNALQASLKIMPEQFSARLSLGRVYLGLKDFKAAEDQFEVALLLQAHNLEAQLGIAKAQIGDGNFAEAVQQLELLSKSHPSAEIFGLLAQAYSGVGKLAAARRAESRAKFLRNKP